MKRALILVDLQNDFCPGGALAVAEGDTIMAGINAIQPRYDLVVATQDWHPADHGSFASQHPGRRPGDVVALAGQPQVLWPDHCVAGTPGAAFHPALDRGRVAKVFPKGTDRAVDSYSGFYDNGHVHATGLGDWLKAEGVTDVDVVGLATDYCVKWTALDAQALGFGTRVIAPLARGVELSPGDVARALDALEAAGVDVVRAGFGE